MDMQAKPISSPPTGVTQPSGGDRSSYGVGAPVGAVAATSTSRNAVGIVDVRQEGVSANMPYNAAGGSCTA
jgi:hypothetical protein